MKANTLDVLDVDWWTADSLPCLQENKSAFLIYLDRSPWKPNACGEGRGVTVDERLANRAWSESKVFSLQFCWCQWLFYICSLMFACLHGPYSIIYLYCTVFMLEYVTTSSCNVNSALSCGLRCPFSHYHGLSDTADSQNTKISYHFIPLRCYTLFFPNGISLS